MCGDLHCQPVLTETAEVLLTPVETRGNRGSTKKRARRQVTYQEPGWDVNQGEPHSKQPEKASRQDGSLHTESSRYKEILFPIPVIHIRAWHCKNRPEANQGRTRASPRSPEFSAPGAGLGLVRFPPSPPSSPRAPAARFLSAHHGGAPGRRII